VRPSLYSVGDEDHSHASFYVYEGLPPALQALRRGLLRRTRRKQNVVSRGAVAIEAKSAFRSHSRYWRRRSMAGVGHIPSGGSAYYYSPNTHKFSGSISVDVAVESAVAGRCSRDLTVMPDA